VSWFLTPQRNQKGVVSKFLHACNAVNDVYRDHSSGVVMLIFSVFQCSSKLILQLFEFFHLLKLVNTRLDLPESLPSKKESSLRYVNNFYLNYIYIYIYIYMTSLEIYASSLFLEI
jgi:hypothetical protein